MIKTSYRNKFEFQRIEYMQNATVSKINSKYICAQNQRTTDIGQ